MVWQRNAGARTDRRVRATISLFFRNVAREAFKVFKVRTPRTSHMPPDADAGSELRDMSSDRIG